MWIFGAWFGEKYFDNPKFLFEHLKKNYPQINAIWVTKDQSICNGQDILYKYSLKAFTLSLQASVFIVTHSTFLDIYRFINTYKRYSIQLWHGIPIKKIGSDDKASDLKNKIKLFLFPFLKEKYSLVISSSSSDKKNMSTAFSVPIEKVAITGYPRNDVFIKQQYNNDKLKILYAPTLRDKVDDEINLFDDFGFDIKSVLKILKEYRIFLDIKMHPANKIDTKFKNSIKSEYIHFLESKIEINEIIQDYSMVISDYSGLYVDYLLTNRPIIFAPFDYEKYITKDRELYYDYDEVTPGPKCKNWDEVLEWVVKFKENPELYKEDREALKNRFHKYQDGKSCERVYREIIKLCKKENDL
ncbi:MAG: CDP-glycerol glycerophosphotransferase family protein [Sulfurimonas sp.]|nr:CDP-glycerol glycerophosphotransferase family protein [Sulfurimonas sp.]